MRWGWIALVAALIAAQPAQASSSCAPKNFEALAGWNGVWVAQGTDATDQGISGRQGRPDNELVGLDAPWNDTGWARMRTMVRIIGSPGFKNAGWGFPMIMHSYAELRFIISPAETVILGQYRDVRDIYTDGRSHPAEEDRWPTNWGDSIGCWEGDTLVIDTVSARYDPTFNALAPPVSEQAHFVERLRLVAPGRIENEITITDPATLSAPWILHFTYVPAGIDRLVFDAFDDRIDTDALTIKPPASDFADAQLPSETKLSATELDRLAGRYRVEGTPTELVVEPHGERLYFEASPALSTFLPMFAETPLTFETIDGARLRFVTDAAGRVTGLEGNEPDGTPMSGKRKSP